MARTTQAPWGQPFQVLRPSGPYAELDRHRAWRPAALNEPGALTRMWYAGHDGTTSRIVQAVEPPRLGWERRGICIDAGLTGVSDAGGVEGPSVLRTADGYLMAYSGSDGTATRTHLATSEDGNDWKSEGVVERRGWSGAPTTCPCLVEAGDRLWLYEAADGPDGRSSVIVSVHDAGSDDAAGDWDLVGTVLAPDGDVQAVTEPWVVVDGGVGTMLLVSIDSEGGRSFRSATSSDLSTWELRAKAITVGRRHHDKGLLSHPSAVRLPTGDLRMWYAAGPEGDDTGACRLWSTDLLHGAIP